jgi:hypothetical protein
MAPQVTVLQLDTHFPRIKGDVGCLDSYVRAPQIIRVRGASVDKIVSARPQDVDITPFEEALARATGDIIVTSCGFLSYWQDYLAALTDRPFISSALTALGRLRHDYTPAQLMILTFDADSLTAAHLGPHSSYTASISGLPPSHHLRHVIEQNLTVLDVHKARTQLRDLIERTQTPAHRHILLECTNLPPYREMIKAVTGLPVTDILTRIEATCPGSIAPQVSRITP